MVNDAELKNGRHISKQIFLQEVRINAGQKKVKGLYDDSWIESRRFVDRSLILSAAAG